MNALGIILVAILIFAIVLAVRAWARWVDEAWRTFANKYDLAFNPKAGSWHNRRREI